MDPRTQINNLQAQLLQHQHTTADGTKSFPFTNLSDVPNSYKGQKGNVATVNATETGLVFASSDSITIYAGKVSNSSSAGSPFPAGWSVTNITAGVCQVTHNLNTLNYVAVATCGDNNITEFYLYNYNSDYFFVNSGIGASSVNCDFSFMLTLT